MLFICLHLQLVYQQSKGEGRRALHSRLTIPRLSDTIRPARHNMSYNSYMSQYPKRKNTSHSALTFVLLGLVPYTRQNLLLTFKPSAFFAELARQSGIPEKTLRRSYQRAVQRKLITVSADKLDLSLKARQSIQPFIATQLPGAQLMVIFDIPEDQAHLRRQLRSVLRELSFRPIQQSVWTSDMDHRAIIIETVEELHLADWVQVFEAAPAKPPAH